MKISVGDLIAKERTEYSKGFYIRSYGDPLQVVKTYRSKKDESIQKLLLENGDRVLSSEGWVLYPNLGDLVVVGAGSYQVWYLEKIAGFSYTVDNGRKNYGLDHRVFVNGKKDGSKHPHDPDLFPLGAVFQVKQIPQKGQAVIVFEKYRYRLPINCLQVLQPARIRRHEQQSA